MKKRTIMIFPEFANMEIINEIRRQYDPLYGLVAPHITLAFPFMSTIANEEIECRLKTVLRQIKPFKIKLEGISENRSGGNYLYLNVCEGRENIMEIQKIVYGSLPEECKPTWFSQDNYIPHITIGKVDNEEEFMLALKRTEKVKEVFETTVKKISVEEIGENEESIIVININLELYLNP